MRLSTCFPSCSYIEIIKKQLFVCFSAVDYLSKLSDNKSNKVSDGSILLT